MEDGTDSSEAMRRYAREQALFHADIGPLAESIMAGVGEADSARRAVEVLDDLCALCAVVRSHTGIFFMTEIDNEGKLNFVYDVDGTAKPNEDNVHRVKDTLSAALRNGSVPVQEGALCATARITHKYHSLYGLPNPVSRPLLKC